jgi:hypothetical protein
MQHFSFSLKFRKRFGKALMAFGRSFFTYKTLKDAPTTWGVF